MSLAKSVSHGKASCRKPTRDHSNEYGDDKAALARGVQNRLGWKLPAPGKAARSGLSGVPSSSKKPSTIDLASQ